MLLFEKLLGSTSNTDSLRAVITRFYRDEIVQLPMTFHHDVWRAMSFSTTSSPFAVSVASSFDISTASSNGLLPPRSPVSLDSHRVARYAQREGEKAARTFSE